MARFFPLPSTVYNTWTVQANQTTVLTLGSGHMYVGNDWGIQVRFGNIMLPT